MRLRTVLIAFLVLVPLSFYAGYRANRVSSRGGKTGPDGCKILHYVDPMNPSFRSAEPGIAPCGMSLEPVCADGGSAGAGAMAPGAVPLRPDRQQLIGMTVETLSRRTLRQSLRLLAPRRRTQPPRTRLSRGTRLSTSAWWEPASRDALRHWSSPSAATG